MSDITNDDLVPGIAVPALGLLEFSSVAMGIRAGDAMVKKAPVRAVVAGSVQPGKFLVLIDGDVSSVEEALAAGLEAGAPTVIDSLFLPDVDPQVGNAVGGLRGEHAATSVGIIETRTTAAAIKAADAGVKGAMVEILEIRLANGLGGKGLVLFTGEVADIEAAVEIGISRVESGNLVQHVVIPALHEEMMDNLLAGTRFAGQWGQSEG